MLTTKLKFRPHVIWSDDKGFHVFGYKGGVHQFVNNQSFNTQYSRTYCHYHNNEIVTFQNNRSIHFNHAYCYNDSVCLSHRHHFGCINQYGFTTIPIDSVNYTSHEPLQYAVQPLHHVTQTFDNTFKRLGEFVRTTPKSIGVVEDGIYNKFESPSGRKLHYWGRAYWHRPPLSANFDSSDKFLLFSWGRYLWINNHCIRFSTNCYDARLSHDQSTIAIATGNEILFMDTQTYQIKMRLNTEQTLHHLAYSTDGLTLGSITKCGKLVIWDVE